MSVLETTKHRAGVVLLTLNRPKHRNALSTELRDILADRFDELASDEGTKVVVLTGSGDAFCAGFDLPEWQRAQDDPQFARRMWASSDRLHYTCLRFPLPMVAAVNGAAVGAGFDLATMSDLRVVANNAWFERPEIDFTVPIYGILHDLVGGALARELALCRRKIPAAEAGRLGLANRVVDGDVVESALELATAIAQTERENLVATKSKIVERMSLAPRPTLGL